MKRKIGRLCMVLGAVLILCAAGLLGYNRWDAARAEKASQEVLGELEQTMQKTITEHQQENETAAPQPVLDPTQEMTTVEVEGRDYIGVLSIPAVERELPVMAQWSYAGLKIAPGRYSGTTYGDDLVICGHNYAMHFSPIKWLAIGSSVYFTDADGLRWSYEVESVETLRPTHSQQDRATIEKTFDELMQIVKDMDQEERRYVREGFSSDEELSLYDMLFSENLSKPDIRKIKAVAVELLQKVKSKIAELDHWTDKQETRSIVYNLIRDDLWSELPACYDDPSIPVYLQRIYEYVYKRYKEVA